MNRKADAKSDSKRQPLSSRGTSPYVEACDEAVDVYLKRDLEAWGKLLSLHERFLQRPWENPLPDRWAGSTAGGNRRCRRRS